MKNDEMIKCRCTYYDKEAEKYFQPDGQCDNPRWWRCAEYEMNDDGDLVLVDVVFMHENDLRNLEVVA